LKYRKVKFFERRKVDRKLDAARKRLAATVTPVTEVSATAAEGSASGGSSGDGAAPAPAVTVAVGKLSAEDAALLRAEVAALEEDRAYVKYYPKDKKYISLFNSLDAKTAARRVQMRSLALATHAAAQAAQRDKAARKRARPGGDGDDDSSGGSESDSDGSDNDDDSGSEIDGADGGSEDDDDAFFVADGKESEKEEPEEDAEGSRGPAKKVKRATA
jgi:hypothetical protein